MVTSNLLRILHVSDLHFGPPYLAQVGRSVVRTALELRPHVVVVSGDLTQRAKRRQYVAARDFLACLPDVPKVVVPGNHDVPLYRLLERLWRPYTLYREFISGELDRVFCIEGAVIVALNSTAPHTAITNGWLQSRQLDLCQAAFRDVPGSSAKIAVVHHPLVPAPDQLRDPSMRGARRVLRQLLDLGVELVLSGHLHRTYIRDARDLFPGTDRDRATLLVQCGTTTSRRGRGRERGRNSLNLIEITTASLQVTSYLYLQREDAFTPVDRCIFPRRQRLAGFAGDGDSSSPE